MKEKTLKTEIQVKREMRETKIYNEFTELISKPGAMITAVNEFIMKKHNIKSPATVWLIRKRVESRLSMQNK